MGEAPTVLRLATEVGMGELRVVCRRDEGGEVPVRFGDPNTMQEVAEVLDRWPGEGHRYFRVRTRDRAVYILRHDEAANSWQIYCFENAPTPRDP